MLNDFYKQFKSGTDIRGVASEGVEGQSVNLTDDVVADMADGFVLWLSKKVSKKQLVFHLLIVFSQISISLLVAFSEKRYPSCHVPPLDIDFKFLALSPKPLDTEVHTG